MEKLHVNFEEIIGKIKAMHGIGQPPLGSWGFGTEHFHYLKEAHIPFSRLHDVGGVFGGNLWVDIPNIFRDFDADETLEENYDFVPTGEIESRRIFNFTPTEDSCKINYYRIER